MGSTTYQQLKKNYRSKQILIVGLGVLGGGIGLAKFFSGIGAKVIVTDKKTSNQLAPALEQLKNYPIKYRLGGHPHEIFPQADVIFKGPFVPWDLPQIVEAERIGIPVEMELSFFAKHFPGKLIGITGTRGKSTTTMMIYELLKRSGWRIHLGGSLPHVSTINYLKSLTDGDWVVMELPSWPLSAFHRNKISPHIGIFTNFYPDHLNFYQSLDDYLEDKKAIYLYQTRNDYLVVNKSLSYTITKDHPRSKIIYFDYQDFPSGLDHLQGKHNLENAAAALTVAKLLKLDVNRSINTIKKFKGVPFRQQIVAKKAGMIFINDTTSTTPIATIKALAAFSDKKILLILGGNSKNLPAGTLIKDLARAEKIILLAGSFTQEILPQLKQIYPDKISQVFDNLQAAVNKACDLAAGYKDPVYILFSPGATSFAMFNNEFHRGGEFNKIISKLP
ncbi:UDP-N-acetylmuramoylalanine--D-glutamate ligase [Candidatus Roizmanbacteria bacterium RIFCSPHIGHO2_01_FULL_39_12c]|uniref:UDP-N-acetylmuramoylalanine--D-glutamate ligase n=1 Tax=Candidatus Roizmanbacteria bacterium RIFCSPHIGHO2_01_FULL_39_12c TaxID=1802031 RepID=A0A1F7G8B7_9BACT|nr:MAG: UDP-N-acetylmuramoylalanine--D-glutamate ligase [Candidatus Roizmanbacteria bacterium RIFCSPHIGHO2_01_FULL_39_12c]